MKKVGEFFNKLIKYCKELYCLGDDPSKLIHVYLMMEDYPSLDRLASTLPENSHLLPQIASAFEAVGLTKEAVIRNCKVANNCKLLCVYC
jgi:hypothetical protein